MRKKYSDPLMFPSVLLGGIVVSGSDNGEVGPDGDITLNSIGPAGAKFGINSAPAASEVTIVDPAEAEVVTEEAPAEIPVETVPEEESVIDMLAPVEEAAPAAEAGE